jgi:RimJ/RimL family protein N-acetyltransferase
MRTAPFTEPWSDPAYVEHTGQFVRLVPTNPVRDSLELFAAAHTGDFETVWRYMTQGPFESEAVFRGYLESLQSRVDWQPYTVQRVGDSTTLGMISVMRIEPRDGVAELGSIWYTPKAQRTATNTETIYLLLKHLFEACEYRRVEWKCDSRNERSAAAARRLGFTHEGCFRQHMVSKAQSRDTLWFAMLDGEWAAKKAHFERVLYSGESVSLSELNCPAR